MSTLKLYLLVMFLTNVSTDNITHDSLQMYNYKACEKIGNSWDIKMTTKYVIASHKCVTLDG